MVISLQSFLVLQLLHGLVSTDDCISYVSSDLTVNFRAVSDHVHNESNSRLMVCNTTIPWWTYHQSEKSVEAQLLIDLTHSIIPKPESFNQSFCWNGFYDMKLLSSLLSQGSQSPTTILGQIEKSTTIQQICIPTFYLISFDDVFSLDFVAKLMDHPSVSLPLNKNSNWYDGDALNNHADKPKFKLGLLKYLLNLNNGIRELSNLVAMDSSSSMIWRNGRSKDLCTIPTFVHGINPLAKFVVVMNAPWTNTYHSFLWHSTVNFFNDTVPSDAEWFHRCVTSQIMWFTHCLSTGASLATCSYDMELVNWDRLFGSCHFNIGASFYYLHLRRWLTLFSKKQFLFLKMEDFTSNPFKELQRIWTFLGLESLPNHTAQQVLTIKDTVTKRHTAMLDETKSILRTFFEPFNRELSELIGDSYRWNDC